MQSLTIRGLVIAVVAMICKGAGVDLGSEALMEFLTTGGEIVGVIMIYVGRIRKGDLNPFGGRKESEIK